MQGKQIIFFSHSQQGCNFMLDSSQNFLYDENLIIFHKSMLDESPKGKSLSIMHGYTVPSLEINSLL